MTLVDGQRTGHVPADDRGLAYGDGLFETLRIVKGKLPLLDLHIARLRAGCEALRFPALDAQMLAAELQQAAAPLGSGAVKLVLTRGSGGRGYRVPEVQSPRRVVSTMPLPAHIDAWRRDGVNLRICATRLEGPTALAGLKHLNRLAQVLARAEWNDDGIQEGLMRDTDGHIADGTMSNLFAVIGGALATPPVGAGVNGVMRRFVCARAEAAGLDWRERRLSDADIGEADEIFISNSLLGVCPVRRIDGSEYGIGTITRTLQADVERELERRACSDD